MSFKFTPSASSIRALETYQRFVGNDAVRIRDQANARRKAITATIDTWLEMQPEADRARFFAQIEALATNPNARKIATHPLRGD
ncbi:hypothetical protein, partial [Defluviimonas sp. WL0075]